METEHDEKKRATHPGAYILPSAFTTANIFCGFYAITSVWNGDLDAAAMAIGIAIVLDGFDGRIARMMGATSKFGLQLDSLADAISFGVAPATLLWAWQMKELGYLGWIAAFLYMICGIMRLARFNVQSSEMKHFLGLPIPAAAGVLVSLVVVHQGQVRGHQVEVQGGIAVLVCVLSYLMISRVRFRSFKDVRVTRKSLAVFFLMVVGSIIITMKLHASFIFLTLMSCYLALGLTEEVILYAAERRRRRREAKLAAGQALAPEDVEHSIEDVEVLRELGADETDKPEHAEKP